MKMPATGAGGWRANSMLAQPDPGRLCPNAPECRRLWLTLPGEDAALCAHCGQRLERHVLAAILAGRLV